MFISLTFLVTGVREYLPIILGGLAFLFILIGLIREDLDEDKKASITKVEKEISQYVKDHKDTLTRPTSAFVTFEYTESVNIILAQNETIKAKETMLPRNIKWEERNWTIWD